MDYTNTKSGARSGLFGGGLFSAFTFSTAVFCAGPDSSIPAYFLLGIPAGAAIGAINGYIEDKIIDGISSFADPRYPFRTYP